MGLFDYIAKQKELAVKDFNRARQMKKVQSNAEKKAYEEAYNTARIKHVQRVAEARVERVTNQAIEDAKYGGKTKRILFQGLSAVGKKLKENKAKRPNMWR